MGLVVLAGLIGAILVPAARPALLLALGLGVLAPQGSALRWASAAALPVAMILGWGGLASGEVREGLLDCASLLSPPAVLRVAEASIVGGVVILLARWLGVTPGSLGLRRPDRRAAALGVLAAALVGLGSLLLGTVLAEPFFGPIRLRLSDPVAIVPALALAVANGTMEELAYRGALLVWMSRVTGPFVALVGQALVFAFAHTGADFVASAVPVLLAVGAGGLLAGVVARRSGSLWWPIVIHVGFDVPLYYVAACRLSADGTV